MKRIITIATIVSLLLLSIIPVTAATTPALDTKYPANSMDDVPVTSYFTFDFNDEVTNVDKTKILVKTVLGSTIINFQEVKLQGDKLIIITPTLDFDKSYNVTIDAGAITLKNGTYNTPISTTFTTQDEMNFRNLMITDPSLLEDLLRNNKTTRDIYVVAPEAYLKEVNIVHKKKASVENVSNGELIEALTNIDIITKKKDVKTVNVTVKDKDDLIVEDNAILVSDTEDSDSDLNTYSIAFSQLPNNYDVIVELKDVNGVTIDEKIIKVVPDSALFSNIEEAYEYETREPGEDGTGNEFSLYELITDEQLFNALLLESDLEKIQIEVRN
ncbi:hypothetical protein EJF36_18430 [Bacillus sp. HMF5848]|uniref:Ig-like domain-containing protein n=1 Tax=Bacillus sp. HMF5848 TaxID=2495421 RepID=UPI000F768913|nr:Ig-like domain-containing protein [Bacillus sp. HMF5848]RSK28686.1 hypothetical protein EJF36_18430 [Bacillus sp. HMF5848]